MHPKTAQKFEQYFWEDNTYKSVVLPPDRHLQKEMKEGLSTETKAIAQDLQQTSTWCAETQAYVSSADDYNK